MRLVPVIAIPVACALISCATTPDVRKEYYISLNTPIMEEGNMVDVVRDKCALETEFSKRIQSIANEPHRSFWIVMTPNPLEQVEAHQLSVLYLEISNVKVDPRGGSRGRESLSVSGELREGGETVASFDASDSLSGITIFIPGPGGFDFGGTEDACATIDRVISRLAREIATWLENPTMDARLGDAT